MMKNGNYILVMAPDDYPGKKYRGRYCYEHRLVYWENTGAIPNVIHHKNENTHDNRFENLKATDEKSHPSFHGGRTIVKYTCDNCGKTFSRRLRGQPYRFCSRQCIGYYNFSVVV